MNHRALPAVALLAIVPWTASAAADHPVETVPRPLALYRDLPRDPLLVMAAHLGDPGRRLDQWIELAERYTPVERAMGLVVAVKRLNTLEGFSLSDDLLAHIGPEVALAIDLLPIDITAAAMQFPTNEAWELVLGRSGFVAAVRDEAALEVGLQGLLAALKLESVQRDGIVETRIPENAAAGTGFVAIHHAVRRGRLVVGFSREWVDAVLEVRRSGERLVDGEDFRKVFDQLDSRPTDLAYVNLPKIRHYVADSQILQLALATQPQAGGFVRRHFTEAAMSVGLGTTTVVAGNGMRTTSFGPPWMSGTAVSSGTIAAMALPNLLAAVDRGRTSQTAGDIESIGVACEDFSLDSETYPGPTEGWIPVERIAMLLEPVYIGRLPRHDAWSRPILYWSDGSSYRIVSSGANGTVDRDWSVDSVSAAASNDIVFADGEFVALPGRSATP